MYSIMSLRVKVVVITLQEYTDRFQKMRPLLESLEKLGFTVDIVYGVNGRKIHMEDTLVPVIKRLIYDGQTLMYNRKIRVNGQQMTPGEFGCMWSHYNVYKKLVTDESADAYLVLEDDAELICELDYFIEAIRNLPTTFDILRTSPSTFFPYTKIDNINPYFYRYNKGYSNFATSYILSKTGAHKAIEYVNGYLNIPADDVLSNMNLFMPGVLSYASEKPWFMDTRTQPSHIDYISSSST
jgi:GR25 family glycosyltransferase involved in LPS biosynthesis